MSTEITTRDDCDGKLLGFAIAGEDRRFYPAEVQYDGPREHDEITVTKDHEIRQPA